MAKGHYSRHDGRVDCIRHLLLPFRPASMRTSSRLSRQDPSWSVSQRHGHRRDIDRACCLERSCRSHIFVFADSPAVEGRSGQASKSFRGLHSWRWIIVSEVLQTSCDVALKAPVLTASPSGGICTVVRIAYIHTLTRPTLTYFQTSKLIALMSAAELSIGLTCICLSTYKPLVRFFFPRDEYYYYGDSTDRRSQSSGGGQEMAQMHASPEDWQARRVLDRENGESFGTLDSQDHERWKSVKSEHKEVSPAYSQPGSPGSPGRPAREAQHRKRFFTFPTMSGILKGGWHPKGKGEGGKESWRSDFRGVNQIAKLAGRGKEDPLSNNGSMQSGLSHSSAPLSTLKDPASFGPPPKHVGAHGPQAAAQSSPAPTPARSYSRPTASSQAPVSQEPQWQAPVAHTQSPQQTGVTARSVPASRPAPPPRPSLPPRQNSRPDVYSPDPPPSYNAAVTQPGEKEGYVNQAAVSRLGQAGVNVSAFGVGGQSTGQGSVAPQGHGGQMNELQSRFSRMKTSASPADDAAPASGTSWAQKQAAARTASKFQKDPSSVSLSDARDAASTANNFRQRHGEQVASGWKTANSLNQRYGVSDRLAGAQPSQAPAELAAPPGPASAAGKKPPPPPPKKKELQTGQPEGDAGPPPPVPTSSKPRF
ncbi:hypothetical protein FH972_026868 [Carpinus fangiana]|uniref:Uncharacterized protein n=1 Tax=Carpinus fangiana TaxID=176857 RepID=A0A5N6L5A6_9ROSI|nr:hypothetical protein FH972_026868 [Carpinus fangiana]